MANVSMIMATLAGFSRKIFVQTERNAGMSPRVPCNGPNASSRYEYSAPDLCIIVPSSAYDMAPEAATKAGSEDMIAIREYDFMAHLLNHR